MKCIPRKQILHSAIASCLALGLLMCGSDDDDGQDIDGSGNAQSNTGGTTRPGTGGVANGQGGEGQNRSGGSSNSDSGGSGNQSTGNVGNIPTDSCEGIPIDYEADVGMDTGGAGAGGIASGAGTGTAAATSNGGRGGAGNDGGRGGAGNSGGVPFEEEPDEDGSGGGTGEQCFGTGNEAEAWPVDLLIVMDRSTSMGYEVGDTGMTRLEALSGAVEAFAQAPEAANIGVGLVFFRSLSGDFCDPESYETPDIPIAPLRENSQDIVDLIASVEPYMLTPVVPALEGAVRHAKRWAADHPDRATVIVLVSDAYPTECNVDPVALADIAGESFQGDPSVPVYAIGVAADQRWNVTNVARQGGTVEPYLTTEDNVGSEFVDALLNITHSELGCEFRIPEPPPGTVLDPELVRMIYTTGTNESEEIPHATSLSQCASSDYGGWYYDNPSNPQKILVCPCTCERFGAGRITIELGCKPKPIFT